LRGICEILFQDLEEVSKTEIYYFLVVIDEKMTDSFEWKKTIDLVDVGAVIHLRFKTMELFRSWDAMEVADREKIPKFGKVAGSDITIWFFTSEEQKDEFVVNLQEE
jgi:hypothetical protein